MSRRFRCLRILDTEHKDCISLCSLLKSEISKNGFSAFFCHSSIITGYQNDSSNPVSGASVKALIECFEDHGITHSNVDIILEKNSDFLMNNVYPLIQQPKPHARFPQGVLAFGGKLREKLSLDENKDTKLCSTLHASNSCKSNLGFALYQAIISNLLNMSYEGSPLYDTGGTYREYLLWNDNDLWEKTDWDKRKNELSNITEEKKGLYLAWLGSGWLSSRLEDFLDHNKSSYVDIAAPFPPEIEAWAKNALESLLEYDAVLFTHFQEKEKKTPPDWKRFHNYINILCDFLPYHKYRDPDLKQTDDEYVSSNSTGDHGGPRLWGGYLGKRMNMHVRHLILDGWITFWPFEGRLYYQPASLALLYWAAKHANKPFTNTPRDFIDNYQWNSGSKNWFSGHWTGD